MNRLTTRPAGVQLHRPVYERRRFLSFENFNPLFGLITGGTRVGRDSFFTAGANIVKFIRQCTLLPYCAATLHDVTACLNTGQTHTHCLADTTVVTENAANFRLFGTIRRFESSFESPAVIVCLPPCQAATRTLAIITA